MELKDFVKGVILDITNAVKECQEEIDNGAIIAPTKDYKGKEKSIDDLRVSSIDFEVAVTAGKSTEVNGEVGGGIKVLSAFIGSKIGGENKESNEDVSKVKFSIPIVYPPFKIAKKRQVGRS